MTEWRLNCYDGKAYTLPNPVAWRLDYGLGSPCDSFWVKTLWSVGQEETLAAGTQMQVFHDGALCFVGVVDECEVRWSEEGCVAELSGRGLQALLLDNQAEAADFGQATLGAVWEEETQSLTVSVAWEDESLDVTLDAGDLVIGT